MIDQISFRDLQRKSSEELRRLINVNGGMIFVEVRGTPKFILKSYPDYFLAHVKRPKV